MHDATPKPVPGTGRCPKCGSRKVKRLRFADPALTAFYSAQVERCLNPACKAVWEWFDPAQLLDEDDPRTSSFKEPCENCAFRSGSVEQRDPDQWRKLMADLKGAGGNPWTLFERGGGFYCHKGVVIDPAGEHGFAYPKDRRKLRPCRGWLRMVSAAADRLKETEDAG